MVIHSTEQGISYKTVRSTLTMSGRKVFGFTQVPGIVIPHLCPSIIARLLHKTRHKFCFSFFRVGIKSDLDWKQIKRDEELGHVFVDHR